MINALVNLQNLEAIPQELRQIPTWINWEFALELEADLEEPKFKLKKVPRDPNQIRYYASSTAESTWSTFEVCVNNCAQHETLGLGFVFTNQNDIIGVDLDDPEGDKERIDYYYQLINQSQSYAEWSPSGVGAHIIMRGHVPNGRHRGGIGLFETERFFTVTANVISYNGLASNQPLLDSLYDSLSRTNNQAVSTLLGPEPDTPPAIPDQDVINRCMNAKNGQKFNLLWSGNWQLIEELAHRSHSEADQALMNIIAFHSDDPFQVRRIFLQAPLAQREKTQTRIAGYVNPTVNRAFDRKVPLVDIKLDLPDVHHWQEPDPAAAVKAQLDGEPLPFAIERPPGLVGDLAEYVFRTAARPLPETSLLAALAFCAGMWGRSYAITGQGVNLYLHFVSPSGMGKDDITQGIDRIMSAVRTRYSAVDEFDGMSYIPSNVGMLKMLEKRKSVICRVHELGKELEKWLAFNAGSSYRGIVKDLLSLYSQSGPNSTYSGAVYSDKDKNIGTISRPGLSLIGDSTPDVFWRTLDESNVADGLIGRFIHIYYNGERPAYNVNRDRPGGKEMSPRLFENVCAAVLNSITSIHNDAITPVVMSIEADSWFKRESQIEDKLYNEQRDNIEGPLRGRALQKILRLAALIAIGVNQQKPTIEVSYLEWARKIVLYDINMILFKFKRGETGNLASDDARMTRIVDGIELYINSPFNKVKSYKASKDLHDKGVISYRYLCTYCFRFVAFNHPHRSKPALLDELIRTLIMRGELEEIDVREHGVSGKGRNGRYFLKSN